MNGSPRLKGNTAMLCDAFASGAESAGHEIARSDLKKLNILDCLGCLKGGKYLEHPCVQKDDMDQIYPAYREADVIVLASPLYWRNFSGLLKRAFDRVYAVYEYERLHSDEPSKLTPKESVLLMAAGLDSPEDWEPASAYYESLTELLNWRDRGRILAPGVINAGDIAGKPALDEARALGASL